MAVPRESQIDAVELDAECYQLFYLQFNQAISHLPIGIFKRIEPEISALINLAVCVVPLYTTSSLVGHQLLGMEFTDKAIKRFPSKWYAYGFLLVGIKWATDRWKTISSIVLREDLTQQPTSQILNYIQITTKILNLLNSLVFLKQGLYPTLLHRVLNLRTQLVDPNQPKSADLSTMTRELLWHSFAETLMFALPLINVHRTKRWFNQFTKLKEDSKGIKAVVTQNEFCAVCNEIPIIPEEAECHHIFCYYCLKANLAADTDFCCPLCSSPAGSNNEKVN